jgi:hypothetical protein
LPRVSCYLNRGRYYLSHAVLDRSWRSQRWTVLTLSLSAPGRVTAWSGSPPTLERVAWLTRAAHTHASSRPSRVRRLCAREAGRGEAVRVRARPHGAPITPTTRSTRWSGTVRANLSVPTVVATSTHVLSHPCAATASTSGRPVPLARSASSCHAEVSPFSRPGFDAQEFAQVLVLVPLCAGRGARRCPSYGACAPRRVAPVARPPVTPHSGRASPYG